MRLDLMQDSIGIKSGEHILAQMQTQDIVGMASIKNKSFENVWMELKERVDQLPLAPRHQVFASSMCSFDAGLEPILC